MKVNFYPYMNFGSLDEVKAKTVYGNFIPQNRSVVLPDSFERSEDVLIEALDKLSGLRFSADDIKKVRRYGANPVFASGQEALNFAKTNKIPIIFGKVDQPDIHAQWINDKHTIVINDAYRTNNNPAVTYAISAAILHELAHAKDGDGISSIQEEIDCLSMNALAFNEYRKQNPKLFDNVSLPILKDGVELYTDLFMGNNEKALIERIRLKYGSLQAGSPNHEPQKFAMKVANI
ncbi:MAG: hypothetical protein K6A44_08170 [bacterium]|nr:hypothetical protein [bacterium]